MIGPGSCVLSLGIRNIELWTRQEYIRLYQKYLYSFRRKQEPPAFVVTRHWRVLCFTQIRCLKGKRYWVRYATPCLAEEGGHVVPCLNAALCERGSLPDPDIDHTAHKLLCEL